MARVYQQHPDPTHLLFLYDVITNIDDEDETLQHPNSSSSSVLTIVFIITISHRFSKNGDGMGMLVAF